MAKPHSLPTFLDHLDSLQGSSITLDLVSELLANTEVSPAHLKSLVQFRPDKYTRNKIHRTPLFDAMILCWPAGKMSPIHDHCDQLGWVRVLSGTLQEIRYEKQDESLDLVEGKPCPLTETARGIQPAGTIVSAVDRACGIHSLGTLEEDAISLHVYSKPHDRCRMFDLEGGPVRWRPLRFDREPDWRGAGQSMSLG